MCLEINKEIDTKTAKFGEIIQLSKESGILIAMYSNIRSNVWHENQTTLKGKNFRRNPKN